jgi:hypothetical protein
MEYPQISPDLTSLDFFLWGAVNNAVYTSTARTYFMVMVCVCRGGGVASVEGMRVWFVVCVLLGCSSD